MQDKIFFPLNEREDTVQIEAFQGRQAVVFLAIDRPGGVEISHDRFLQ